jgi:hypothetical protein
MREPQHHSQDQRQTISDALAARFMGEPTQALGRRLEREEAARQGRLGEERAAWI